VRQSRLRGTHHPLSKLEYPLTGIAPASSLKVLRIISRLNVGGPARHVTTLDAGLRTLGYETLLVHGSVGAGEGDLERLVSDRQLPATKVPALGRRLSPLDDLRAFLAILSLTFRTTPDVVHTHTAKGGTLGRLAAATYNLTRPRRGRCLVVHTFHGHVFTGYFGRFGSAMTRAVERALALCATDRVIAISNLQKRDIVERFRIAPERKVSVVPLGLALDRYLDLGARDVEAGLAYGFTPQDVVFAFAGRLVPIKDVATLIRAFALVAARVPHARLLIAGDGELGESLHEEAERLGVQDRVTFAGWFHDPVELLSLVDVAVLSSINEGTPLWLIEAMAAARPVAATAVGGVPDVVEAGVSGLLVPPGDAQALAAVMERLATQPAERAGMGAAGRAFVSTHFSEGRLVRDIARLYREGLAAKRSSGSPAA